MKTPKQHHTDQSRQVPMLKRPARFMTTAALVVGALLGACADAPGPTEVDVRSPEASPYDGLTIQAAMMYVQTTGATLVSKESEDFGAVATAIIDEDGGTLRVGGHTLQVPPNAVNEDTWFRMEVVSGANILVDLDAWVYDEGELDDRVYTFNRTLNLILSYDGILSKSDLDRLRNVYLYRDSPKYMIPLGSTINTQDKTITSPIEHFSRYGMAIE